MRVLVMYSCVCVSLDIPVKVVGILPQRNERGLLLKMAYALFERLSVYRYGRIELNLFISEREYLVRSLLTSVFRKQRRSISQSTDQSKGACLSP